MGVTLVFFCRCYLTLVHPRDNAGTHDPSTSLMFDIMTGVPLTSVVQTLGTWCMEEEVYKASVVAFVKNKNPSSLIKENELPYPTTDAALLNKKWYETFIQSINDLGIKQNVGQMREWHAKNKDKALVNRRRTPSGAVVSPELNLEKDQIAT